MGDRALLEPGEIEKACRFQQRQRCVQLITPFRQHLAQRLALDQQIGQTASCRFQASISA